MLCNACLERFQILLARFPVDEHRANASAEKMIGTACAQPAQLLRPFGVGEGKRVLVVCEMSNHTPVGRNDASQCGQNRSRHSLAISNRLVSGASKYRAGFAFMLVD